MEQILKGYKPQLPPKNRFIYMYTCACVLMFLTSVSLIFLRAPRLLNQAVQRTPWFEKLSVKRLF